MLEEFWKERMFGDMTPTSLSMESAPASSVCTPCTSFSAASLRNHDFMLKQPEFADPSLPSLSPTRSASTPEVSVMCSCVAIIIGQASPESLAETGSVCDLVVLRLCRNIVEAFRGQFAKLNWTIDIGTRHLLCTSKGHRENLVVAESDKHLGNDRPGTA